MTHPEARADAGLASERQNESCTSPHTRGHSMSGDRDVEAADQAVARPPTRPPGGHGRKAAPRWDRANPTVGRPPVPTHSRTATPADRRPKSLAPSWSEERDGASDSTSCNSTYVENEVKTRSFAPLASRPCQHTGSRPPRRSGPASDGKSLPEDALSLSPHPRSTAQSGTGFGAGLGHPRAAQGPSRHTVLARLSA
jgi:hypothetical protein